MAPDGRLVIRTCSAILLLLGSSRGLLRAQATPPTSESLQVDLRQVIEDARNRVFPALVNIQLVTSMYSGGKAIKARAVGSGTIIDLDGHVLTNQHVTHNGRRFRCTLAGKQEVSAVLVGEDPLTDLAVLRLNAEELRSTKAELHVAGLGDSSLVKVGDFVMAMGSPLALSRSVTLGIVSNTERVFAEGLFDQDPDDMRLSPGQRTGLFTRWIQHDALINPGNSGGPLVNLRGEIIGVNELGGGAMGFAIPSNLAREVARSLIAHGEVARSWIGVTFKPIEKTGLSRGVLVNSVVKGSPADKAGLAPGDVVVQIGDEPITVRFAEEVPILLKRIADFNIGADVTLAFERGAEAHHVSITTDKLHKDRGEEREFRKWGITALDITPLAALEHHLDSAEGVFVSGVRGGSSAAVAKPALQDDDVIKSLDGKPVLDLSAFAARYEQLTAADAESRYIAVEFERGGENYVTLVRSQPEDQDDLDPPRALPKAWIGVAVQPVLKDLAAHLGGAAQTGFRVTRVYPNTVAATADLKAGDIITHINRERVEPRRAEDAGLFERQVQRLDVGTLAELTILRDGQPKQVAVTLEESRPGPDEARRERNADFELTVREVTFFDRVSNRWDASVQGVMVMHAESAGWAGIAGILPGDLIQRIDQHEITDLDSFRRAMEAVGRDKSPRVAFALLRGVRTRFQYAEPDWGPQPPDS